jgi:hypothetical protein
MRKEDLIPKIQNASPNESVNLSEYEISELDAAEQRNILLTFAEDWNSPEMDAYDKL